MKTNDEFERQSIPSTRGTDFTPPQYTYDLLAEQALLKIALCGDPFALQQCGTLIPLFWSGRHKQLASVLAGMHRNGQHVDLVSVIGQVRARGLITKLDGVYLHTVSVGPGDHSGAAWYADRIRELAGRRQLREATLRIGQRLDWGWAQGNDIGDLEVRTAIAEFRESLDELEAVAGPEGLAKPQPLAEFMDGPMEFDWIIPGLLERGERILITGIEGGGKTWLCSQLAACMAGSIHPFSAAVLGRGDHGVRVTVIDCENSAVQSRRRYKRIIGQVDQIRGQLGVNPADWKEHVSIDIRPEGIDLLRTRDVALLEHAISVTTPDLLVLGPLYKIFNADPSSESAVREVASVLDGLRARHGFALLIEAHAGKAEDGNGDRRMGPIGSSLWLRWVEYGFGLRRAKAAQERRPELMDVVSWKGSREERQWPEQLRHGHRLPWEPPPERVLSDDVDYYEPEERCR